MVGVDEVEARKGKELVFEKFSYFMLVTISQCPWGINQLHTIITEVLTQAT